MVPFRNKDMLKTPWVSKAKPPKDMLLTYTDSQSSHMNGAMQGAISATALATLWSDY